MRSEFSRPLNLDELEEQSRLIELIASQDECRLLAKRFEQKSIRKLRANLTLAWLDRGVALSVFGNFRAEVVQTCVVSLDPVKSVVNEKVNLVFARDIEGPCNNAGFEDAEPLEGNTLDFGEIIAGELSLALDPYPRRQDIDPAAINLGTGISFLNEDEVEKLAERRKPFDVLASLKSKP